MSGQQRRKWSRLTYVPPTKETDSSKALAYSCIHPHHSGGSFSAGYWQLDKMEQSPFHE